MSPAFGYVRADSVFLTRGDIVCLTCLDCPCILTPHVLDSFMLAPELRGLPLQASVRAWNNDGVFYFIALGGGHKVIRGQYRAVGVDSTERVIFDTIVASRPGGATANSGLVYYGIDSLHVTPSGLWTFRVFGNRGVRAATFSVSAENVVTAGSDFSVADSLTITASGRGMYGTMKGYVLDSALGYAHPVKVFDRPVVKVNDSGAVSDSGGFALKEYGAWRTFKLGSAQLRDFRLSKVAPEIGPSNQERGAWGTHAEVWNDSFSAATYLVKDDSSTWVHRNDSNPTNVLEDSIRVFKSGADSTALTLFDSDANPAHPTIWIQRSGSGRDTLDGLWRKFQKGCAGVFNDTVSCLPWKPFVPLNLSWDQSYVRLRFEVLRGHWTLAIGGLTDNTFYHFFSDTAALSYRADTSFSWSKGDTLVVRFSNATYSLVHDAEPSLIRGKVLDSRKFEARVTLGGIDWERNGLEGGPLSWALVDLRGVVIQAGTLVGPRGRITLKAPSGMYRLVVRQHSDMRKIWNKPALLF